MARRARPPAVPPAIAPVFCFSVWITFVVTLEVVLGIVEELGAEFDGVTMLEDWIGADEVDVGVGEEDALV
jgi:hypothetical protein